MTHRYESSLPLFLVALMLAGSANANVDPFAGKFFQHEGADVANAQIIEANSELDGQVGITNNVEEVDSSGYLLPNTSRVDAAESKVPSDVTPNQGGV